MVWFLGPSSLVQPSSFESGRSKVRFLFLLGGGGHWCVGDARRAGLAEGPHRTMLERKCWPRVSDAGGLLLVKQVSEPEVMH